MKVIECPKCKGRLENVSEDDLQMTCLYCRAVIDLTPPKVERTQGQWSHIGNDMDVFLRKGFSQLELEQWDEATHHFNRVIAIDSTCAEAYLGLLLASRRKSYEIDLKKEVLQPFTEDVNFKAALKFADADLRKRLKSYDRVVSKKAEKHAEVLNLANQRFGWLFPLVLTIPITIIIAELWFLIVWGELMLVNGELFDFIPFMIRWGYPVWPTYVGFVVAWLVALAIAYVIELARQVKKVEAELAEKE